MGAVIEFKCATYASGRIFRRSMAFWSAMQSVAYGRSGTKMSRIQRMAECFLAAYLEKRRTGLQRAAS